MNFNNLLLENKNGIAYITINRPDKLNALNKETIDELNRALTEVKSDSTIRAVIITGSGQKAFVAGADISEFAHFSTKQGKELSADGQNKLFDYLENFEKPVIAAINGFALGGGLELAMACHIRVASENAKMGLPEVSLGVIPGYGGTQRLPQLVGKGKALELILTADMIAAGEALALGLVNHLTSFDNLIPKCEEIAFKMNAKSPMALASAIRSVNAGFNTGLNGYESEISEFGICFETNDFKEGTSAFMEKRKPNFPGN